MMTSLEKKSFDAPDREVRPPNSHGRLVDFDGMTVGRYTYQPGWR